MSKLLTHHDAAVEAFGTDSHDNVFADALKDLAPRNHEAVCMPSIRILASCPVLALELQNILIRHFLDSIRLAGSSRFITFDVVPGNEYTVAWNDFAGFYESDVANDDLLRCTVSWTE